MVPLCFGMDLSATYECFALIACSLMLLSVLYFHGKARPVGPIPPQGFFSLTNSIQFAQIGQKKLSWVAYLKVPNSLPFQVGKCIEN